MERARARISPNMSRPSAAELEPQNVNSPGPGQLAAFRTCTGSPREPLICYATDKKGSDAKTGSGASELPFKRIFEPRLDRPLPFWMVFSVIFAALYARHFPCCGCPITGTKRATIFPPHGIFFALAR